MTHWLTPDGYNVMLRGLMGDAIKFTRIKYGNGTPGDGANDLKNPLLSLKIASATRSEKYVTLSVSFKNVELEITGFWATEIGIYVEDPDDSTKELCYCIWEETEVEKADYINPNVERLLASQYDFVVFVSEAKNVSAALGETLVYATVTELNNHKNDKNNPHKVTKEQIGLGNVENKALIDQTPTFATAKELSDISSGEKMGSILGKIAKAPILAPLRRRTRTTQMTSTMARSLCSAVVLAATSGRRTASFSRTVRNRLGRSRHHRRFRFWRRGLIPPLSL